MENDIEGFEVIIVKEKPLKEIIKIVTNFKSVLIIGCNGCAGIYQVGGEKQALMMKHLLDLAFKLQGFPVKSKAMTTLRQCDKQVVSTSVRPLIEEYDAILSMACGVGVQILGELFDKPVIPANDTMFIGGQDRELGKLHEYCRACGDCILFETGGICPITRCAKGLLNGPCGGMADGKCEVDGWTRNCAWVQIFNRLKKLNRLESFATFRPPRDYRISQPPRELGSKLEEEKDITR
jgi:hypothetical protein